MFWLIKTVLLLLITVNVYSNEIRTYLIYREGNFPQDRFWITKDKEGNKIYKNFSDMGYKNIKDIPDGQPSKITRYSTNYNGKYGLISYSSINDIERTAMVSIENNGLGKLLILETIVDEYSKSKGGSIRDVRIQRFGVLPDDYYPVYDVEFSTK